MCIQQVIMYIKVQLNTCQWEIMTVTIHYVVSSIDSTNFLEQFYKPFLIKQQKLKNKTINLDNIWSNR